MSRRGKRPQSRPVAKSAREDGHVTATVERAGAPVAWFEGGGEPRRSVVVASAVAHHGEPLAALEDLRLIAAELEQLQAVYVGRARTRGLSWDAIGAALGVPGETLRRRHQGGS